MIVITGSESFIGRELISQCKKNSIEFTGLDIINKQKSDYNYHQINIKSPNIIDHIPENTDAVIHLAALSRDSDCKEKAYECFDNNVLGTLNLINACKEKNVKQFIFASSEWVYDEFKNNEEKNEESLIDIHNHKSEYALSKLVSESNLRQQYNHSFCDVTILRFGIIYGPRKSNWSAVESIFNQVKNQNQVTVGSLKTGRRFVHVYDIISGIINSLGLKGFNIINLTGNDIVTLKDIIDTSQQILNKKIDVVESNSEQISIRNPSNSKAKQIIGWQPEIDLKLGLESLIPYV